MLAQAMVCRAAHGAMTDKRNKKTRVDLTELALMSGWDVELF